MSMKVPWRCENLGDVVMLYFKSGQCLTTVICEHLSSLEFDAKLLSDWDNNFDVVAPIVSIINNIINTADNLNRSSFHRRSNVLIFLMMKTLIIEKVINSKLSYSCRVVVILNWFSQFSQIFLSWNLTKLCFKFHFFN